MRQPNMTENEFFFNKRLVQTINMVWRRRGVNAGARLKKYLTPAGDIRYTIISNLVVDENYIVDVKREK